MAKRHVTTRRPVATPVYQTIPVNDMTGGLDFRRSPTLLSQDRSVVCRNFSLAEPGALRVRSGYTAFTTSALSTRAAQAAHRIYLGSTQGTLIADQGGIYLLPDNGVWDSTAKATGYSTSVPIYFVHDRDLVAAFDGVTVAKKSTDFTTWTRFGIQTPVTASTLSSNAGASDLSTSEFGLVYTYKDRGTGFESDPSTAQSTISLKSTGFQIIFNCPNSTDAQVDAVRVYAKSITAGEQVYRLASSGPQGTAGTTLVIASSAWGTNDEAPSTHGAPPILSFGVSWKNRWWARSSQYPTRLHFSEIFQPQGWPALYYIDLPFHNGEEINAILPQGDTLLCFGDSQIFMIIGQTSLDFEVRPSLGAQSGAVGPKAVALVEAGAAHVSAEGVFIFDGATDRLLTNDLTPGWKDMIDSSPSSSIEQIPIVYDWREKEVRVSVPRCYPTADPGEFVLDLNRTRENQQSAWSQTDRTIRHYIFWDGDEPVQGNRGKLQSVPSTAVKVFTESDGQSADGADMSAEYDGPTFATGLNRARFTDLHVEYEPHGGNAVAETVVDGQSQGQISLTIGSGVATWGTLVYGTSLYGGTGRRKAYTPLPLGADGRNAQQKFTYLGQESFALYTYSLGMVPEVAPRQFSE